MRPFDRNGLWIDLTLVIGLSLTLVFFALLPHTIDYIMYHSFKLLGLAGLALIVLLVYRRRRR